MSDELQFVTELSFDRRPTQLNDKLKFVGAYALAPVPAAVLSFPTPPVPA